MRTIYSLLQLLGLVLCFFIFPVGIILGLILILAGGIGYRNETKKTKEEENLIKCPYCAESIQKEAIICKHCGKDLKDEKITR